MSEPHLRFHISVDAYCKFLLIFCLLFVSAHLGLNYYNHRIEETEWLLHQLFELDEENNLPTWFSSFLLLNNAFVLYAVGENCIDKFKSHWKLLSLGFLILSIDEVAGIHETFNTAVEFNWAVLGGLIVGVVGIIYIPFLLALDRALALKFVISGCIFVGGAIGVELLSEDMDEDTIMYGFATAVEEGMEMIGALMFLYVNLNEHKKQHSLEVVISPSVTG